MPRNMPALTLLPVACYLRLYAIDRREQGQPMSVFKRVKDMSGKLIPKPSPKSYDSQNPATKSASIPPPMLPPRAGSKNVPPYPAPHAPGCQKCQSGDCSTHRYEDVQVSQSDQEVSQYEKLGIPEDAMNNQISARLLKIEDNQTRLRGEFNDFRESIEQSIKSLHLSVKRVMEMNDSLDESMRESFTFIQSNMEKSHQQLLENSDHLGKQMLDIRRDISAAAQTPPPANRRLDSDLNKQQRKRYTHILDWEVSNIDRLVTLQQNASSQSHLIGQLDFKIIGGAQCTRDGLLRVKISGMFTHMPAEAGERKNGNFECRAFLVDKSGKEADMLVGKVIGDFNTGKEWVVGNVPVAKIKVDGYATRDGNVNLKFVIDVSV